MFNQPVFTQIGTLVQAQMKAIGVQVNLRPLDPATLDQLTIKKEYQSMVTREGYPMGLSDDYIWKQYSGTGNDNRTYLNMPDGLQVPELERLIDAARGAKDRASAKALYRQVASLIVANAVEVTIGFPKNVDVVSTRVQNWYVGGTVLELLRDVWVQ
jgi:ABC-type transport system substrate-binding protein